MNILDGDEKDSWDYFKAAVPDVRILAGERFGKFGRKLQHQMWISLNAHIHQKDKNTKSQIWKKASTSNVDFIECLHKVVNILEY